jgi:hypothetical protein
MRSILHNVQVIDTPSPAALNIGLAHFVGLDNMCREHLNPGTDYD